VLKQNNLMLRSERRERLDSMATSDSLISHSQNMNACFMRVLPLVAHEPLWIFAAGCFGIGIHGTSHRS